MKNDGDNCNTALKQMLREGGNSNTVSPKDTLEIEKRFKRKLGNTDTT